MTEQASIKIKEIENSNNILLTAVKSLQIETEEDLAKALDLNKKVKEAKKKIKERKEEITRPINDSLKSIRNLFAPQEEKIAEIQAILENEKVKPYYRKKEEEQRKKIEEERQKEIEELEKQKQEEPNDMEKALIEDKQQSIENKEINIKGTVHSNMSTTSFRKVWKAEIIDTEKVPREYCEPAMKLINEAVKRGEREIPGVKIYEDTQIISR